MKQAREVQVVGRIRPTVKIDTVKDGIHHLITKAVILHWYIQKETWYQSHDVTLLYTVRRNITPSDVVHDENDIANGFTVVNPWDREYETSKGTVALTLGTRGVTVFHHNRERWKDSLRTESSYTCHCRTVISVILVIKTKCTILAKWYRHLPAVYVSCDVRDGTPASFEWLQLHGSQNVGLSRWKCCGKLVPGKVIHNSWKNVVCW